MLFLRITLLSLIGLLTLTFFNNCGEGFESQEVSFIESFSHKDNTLVDPDSNIPTPSGQDRTDRPKKNEVIQLTGTLTAIDRNNNLVTVKGVVCTNSVSENVSVKVVFLEELNQAKNGQITQVVNLNKSNSYPTINTTHVTGYECEGNSYKFEIEHDLQIMTSGIEIHKDFNSSSILKKSVFVELDVTDINPGSKKSPYTAQISDIKLEDHSLAGYFYFNDQPHFFWNNSYCNNFPKSIVENKKIEAITSLYKHEFKQCPESVKPLEETPRENKFEWSSWNLVSTDKCLNNTIINNYTRKCLSNSMEVTLDNCTGINTKKTSTNCTDSNDSSIAGMIASNLFNKTVYFQDGNKVYIKPSRTKEYKVISLNANNSFELRKFSINMGYSRKDLLFYTNQEKVYGPGGNETELKSITSLNQKYSSTSRFSYNDITLSTNYSPLDFYSTYFNDGESIYFYSNYKEKLTYVNKISEFKGVKVRLVGNHQRDYIFQTHQTTYFRGKPVNVDFSTFNALFLRQNRSIFKRNIKSTAPLFYYRDRNFVYHYDLETETLNKLSGEKYSGLSLLNLKLQIVLGQDKAYYNGKILKGITYNQLLKNTMIRLNSSNYFKSRTNNTIYYFNKNKSEFVLMPVDSITFRTLSENFAYDKNNLFHKDRIKSNISTDLIKVSSSYFKNNNKIYYINKQLDSITEVLDADYNTFEYKAGRYFDKNSEIQFGELKSLEKESFIVGETYGGTYYKSNNKIYYYEGKTHQLILVDGAHAKTFQTLHKIKNSLGLPIKDSQLFKDKNSIFINGVKQSSIDAHSFKKLAYHYQDNLNLYKINSAKQLIKVPGGDPNTYEIIDKFYSKDKNNVYYLNNTIEGAHPNSFRDLNLHKYYRDDKRAYFNGKALSETVDLDSFRPLILNYAKDKNNFYKMGKELTNIDYATYQPLSFFYSKDKNKIYSFLSKTTHYDKETFEALGDQYAKDANKVYYRGKEFKGVDRDSFQGFFREFSKDKNSVYFRTTPLKHIDSATFEHLGNAISRDKNKVYLNMGTYSTSDGPTFIKLNKYYSKDKNNAYYHDNSTGYSLIEKPENFTLIEGVYAKDSKNVYYQGKILDRADPTTFKKYIPKNVGIDKQKYKDLYFFKDKNRKYYRKYVIEEIK